MLSSFRWMLQVLTITTTMTMAGCTACQDDDLIVLDAALEGVICNDAAVPEAGVAIRVVDSAGVVSDTVTDSAGAFALGDLATGEATITVDADADDDGVSDERVLVVELLPSTVTVVSDEACGAVPGVDPIETGSVGGNVCSAPGVPATSVELYRVTADGEVLVSTTPTAGGLFVFAGLEAGTYVVVAGDARFPVVVEAGRSAGIYDDRCGVACTETLTMVAGSSSTQLPVDIIVAIDSSRSMREASSAVQQALNELSSSVTASGIDHHVIVVGVADVPPPLGTSTSYREIETEVDSSEPLVKIVATRSQWSSFVRADSFKHVVVVTDDESEMGAATFANTVDSWAGFAGRWMLHGVIATADDVGSNGGGGGGPGGGGGNGNNDGRCGAARGRVYETLIAETGGTLASVCDTDWSQVIDAVVTSITTTPTTMPCDVPLPDLPAGTVFDGASVILWDADNAVIGTYEVAATTTCASDSGFVLDDVNDPVAFVSCDATCAAIEAASSLTAVVRCSVSE